MLKLLFIVFKLDCCVYLKKKKVVYKLLNFLSLLTFCYFKVYSICVRLLLYQNVIHFSVKYFYICVPLYE